MFYDLLPSFATCFNWTYFPLIKTNRLIVGQKRLIDDEQKDKRETGGDVDSTASGKAANKHHLHRRVSKLDDDDVDKEASRRHRRDTAQQHQQQQQPEQVLFITFTLFFTCWRARCRL